MERGLLRRSPPRVIDLFYWPAVNVLLWGFLSQFLASNSSFVARAGGVLLAGMFLWDVMFRSQIGVAVGQPRNRALRRRRDRFRRRLTIHVDRGHRGNRGGAGCDEESCSHSYFLLRTSYFVSGFLRY